MLGHVVDTFLVFRETCEPISTVYSLRSHQQFMGVPLLLQPYSTNLSCHLYFW